MIKQEENNEEEYIACYIHGNNNYIKSFNVAFWNINNTQITHQQVSIHIIDKEKYNQKINNRFEKNGKTTTINSKSMSTYVYID